MKAALFLGDARKLSVEDIHVATDPLGPNDVRIEIGASGVCGSDLAALQGTYGSLHPPLIMGHEGAGTVVAIGDAVSRVAVGDRVITSFVASCGICFHCVRGQSNLCELHGTLRSLGISHGRTAGGEAVRAFCNLGTFAEEMIVHEAYTVAVRTELPDQQLALLGCGVTTGVCAVFNTAGVQPGASVAVIGCGGVGQAVVQGARIAGAARIFAIDPVVFKRDSALALGATDAIDPGSNDPVELLRDATEGRGVDYVFDVVGRAQTILQAHAAARLGGIVVLIGAGVPGEVVPFDVFALHEEKRLLGCRYGSAQARRDIPRLVALAESGTLDIAAMVTRTMRIDDVNDALQLMSSGEVLRSVLIG